MLSAAEIAGFKELIQYALVHKYTREAVADGAENDWKMATVTYGAAVVDIPCNYLSDGVLTTREKSITVTDTPSIMIADTDTLKIGDRITNIKDATGTIVLVGPIYVENIAIAMGFGTITNYIAALQGTRPVKW